MKHAFTCKHLRSKSMFIPALAGQDAAGGDAHGWGHSSHAWCNCTLSEVGPDDRPVNPEACRPPRACCEE